MTQPAYDVPPEDLPDERTHRRLTARAVRGLMAGRANVVLDVTLNASATSTVVKDPRIHPYCHVAWEPTSASASTAEKAGIWTSSKSNGAVTLNHASNAATDQTLRLTITG